MGKKEKKDKDAKSNKTEEKMALEKKIEDYRLELIQNFGYTNKDIKADPDMAEMVKALAKMKCRVRCTFSNSTVPDGHAGRGWTHSIIHTSLEIGASSWGLSAPYDSRSCARVVRMLSFDWLCE